MGILSNIWDKMVLEPAIKSISTKELIEQIHNEFNTAGDLLLKEANSILEKTIEKDEIDKINLLRKFNFNNVPELQNISKKIDDKKKAKEILIATNEISLRYPQYKIIHKSDIEKICKKYNLVYGEVELYKGFVPLKNLKEMDNFKLHEDDWKYFGGYGGYGNRVEISKDVYEYLINYDSRDEYYIDKESKFLICAPAKDMIIDKDMIVKNYKIEHVPDPVVLRHIKDDLHLILTAWGDESSDPLVFNHKNN